MCSAAQIRRFKDPVLHSVSDGKVPFVGVGGLPVWLDERCCRTSAGYGRAEELIQRIVERLTDRSVAITLNQIVLRRINFYLILVDVGLKVEDSESTFDIRIAPGKWSPVEA